MVKKTKGNKSETQIKSKVILGFAILIIALAVSGYLIYRSFDKLLKATETLSKPNGDLSLFNDVLIDLSKLEINTRSYLVTDEDTFLHRLIDISEKTSKKIELIGREPDLLKDHQLQIDSIQRLLAEIPKNIREIRGLKNQQQSSSFSDKIRRIIKLEMTAFGSMEGDTLFLATDTLQQLTMQEIKKVEKVLKDKFVREIEAPKKKGLFRKIGDLFTRKSKRKKQVVSDSTLSIPEIEETIKTQLRFVLDSVVISQPDVSLKNINKTLADLNKEEYQLWNEINSKELLLIQKNFSIINSLRDVLNRLEKQANYTSKSNKTSAREFVSRTNYQIFLITLISVFCASILIYFIFNDLTKSKFYRRELIKAKREAEKLTQAKERFIANMSHEIRTPLHAIIGYTEQLKKNKHIVHELDEPLDAIFHSSEHLLDLVNDILDLSKIDSEQPVLKEECFSLKEITEQVIQSLQTKARAKKIALNYHIDKEADLVYVGDALRVKQVLYNLAGNAVKFTEEGSVFLRANIEHYTDNKCQLTIEIEDTGIGISEEGQKRLFETFYQADNSISKKYGGSGLGLSISYRLVKAMKGAIHIQSTVGKGSVFQVIIPIKIAEKQEISPNITTEEQSEKKLIFDYPYNILAADDDTFNLKLYQSTLKNMGLTTDTALNGMEALKKLKENQYDLLLLDNQMPGMSGLEVLQYIRNDMQISKEQFPVVIVTANIVKKDIDNLLESGANGYLLKPYKEEELYLKIAGELRNKKPSFIAESDMDLYIDYKNTENMYSLEDIKKLCMHDEELIQDIISQFLSEGRENISEVKVLMERKEWLKIAEIMHRMYSRFAQFRILDIPELMKDAEMNIRQNQQEQNWTLRIQDIVKNAEKTLDLMENDLKKVYKL